MIYEEARKIEDAFMKRTGVSIPAETTHEILEYTMRKLKVIGRSESYFPILYENELHDYFMRTSINLKGERNHVPTVSKTPVSSKLSKRTGPSGLRKLQMV